MSQSKPDLLEPISFGSEVRLLALEQELQDLREKVATIVKSGNQSVSRKYLFKIRFKQIDRIFVYVIIFLEPCLTSKPSNRCNDFIPPPPPPPLPPPTTPHIARRASLQEHINEEKTKPPLNTQKSMGDIIRDIDKIKLKPIARYVTNILA